MHAYLLKLLRIGALALGWLLVIGVLAVVWSQFDFYRGSQRIGAGIPIVAVQFDALSAFSSLFSSFGNAFFAFLIAAVVRMVEKQAPVGIEGATRLMIVCCLSYVAEALVRIGSSILNLLAAPHLARGFDWLLAYSSSAIPALVPILYAAAIFVFYTHFTRMVTFESEVA
jgi:hypothetical protein